MAIPKDYVCDGQLNIWDFVTEDYSAQPEQEETETKEKKPYEYDFERYIGQKVWCWLPEEDEPQIGEIVKNTGGGR